MNKDALDAIGEVIKTAMASSDARIRRLENELVLLGDNHATALKALKADHQAELDAIRIEQATVEARLASRELEAKAVDKEIANLVGAVNAVGHTKLPEIRDTLKADMAAGNLELLGLIEALEQKTADNTAAIGGVLSTATSTHETLKDTTAAVREMGAAIERTTAEVKAIDARVAADTKSYPAYEDGEVVRKGSIRRFGFGGLFEAAYDTAKGVHDAPDAWVMLSDGLVAEESELGVRLRSFSGNVDTLLHHGTTGAVGQRGKQGDQGLRGNDGDGISDVVVSEHGMFLELTSGKSFVFDFSKPLEHAINEVAPVIESIALKALAKQGAP